MTGRLEGKCKVVDDDGAQRLANAVVILSAKDLRKALRAVKNNPRNRKAAAEVAEIEEFLRSEGCSRYTDVPGEMLIRKLREEVGL